MKTLKLWGYSDDLICVDGTLPHSYEEYDTYGAGVSRGVLMVRCPPNVATPWETGLNVHFVYDGCWAMAVTPVPTTENEALPKWKITREWGTEKDYSETLLIECPDDAKAEFVYPKKL